MTTRTIDMPLRFDRLSARPVFVCASVLTLLGLLAIVLPHIATLATVLFIGGLLLVAGISGLYVMIQGRSLFNWRSMGALFLVTGVVGLIFLVYPDIGIRVLTAILAVLLLFEGIVYTAVGTQFRELFTAWKWMVFSGVISLLLALLILIGWPATTTVVMGLLIGFNFLSSGLSLFMLGSAVKSSGTL